MSDKTRTINILTTRHGSEDAHNFHCFYKDIEVYSVWNEVEYLGSEFVCRFCGDNDKKNFKKKNAHTFPEFAGNKWLFSKDECKNCNEKFSRYENELAAHGHLMRTIYGMVTKKSSSATYKNEKFRLQKENDGFVMKVDISENVKTKVGLGDLTFELDFEKNIQRANVTIPEKDYIPLYLFKCLSKIAFSIMPENEIKVGGFEKFKNWLIEIESGVIDESYEPFFHIFHNRMPFNEQKPLLMLFKKVEKYIDFEIPTYSFLFSYGNHFFQIFLPYIQADEHLKEKDKLHLHVIPEITKEENGKLKFIWMNGSNREKVRYKDMEYSVVNSINNGTQPDK